MKVGYLQYAPQFGEIKNNLKKVKDLLYPHKDAFIVLPELFATGYQFRDKKEAKSLAESISGGLTIRFLVEMAKRRNCYYVGSLPEIEKDKLFISAVLVGPKGLIGKYRKSHLFMREKDIFTPGDSGFSVFEANGLKVGMLICFDWIFPEATRTLALAGAHLIAHPSNLILPYCQDAMITRSIENRIYTITANRTGKETRIEGQELAFTGRSQVTSPNGSLLAASKKDAEEVILVKIDPQEAANKQITGNNNIIEDRRADLYKLK